MKIIECIPNFSEGRNQETMEALSSAVRTTKAKLLGLEADKDYNRAVLTFAGDEASVIDAALEVSRTAARQIDMRFHKGAHPRIGAIDVMPFVPVRDLSMEDCVALSEEYARIISKELEVPVYLYEESARYPERRNLARVRKGEYEGLKERLQDPSWAPDFGPAEFNSRLGAIITGARFFLVAYNVNLETKDMEVATRIAETLRESGKILRDQNGAKIMKNGVPLRVSGRLKSVKAMGVSLNEYGITQVSMNLTNYRVTSVAQAFEEVKAEAQRLGVKVRGSELIGLIPLEAMLDAGRYYAKGGASQQELLNLAKDRLGLDSLRKFMPDEKIIDFLI